MKFTEMAIVAGATDEVEAEMLLWGGTAFPFAPVRTIWYQLRHVVRHKICFDDPMAVCCSHRAFKRDPHPTRLP